jgi:hypothetical protein
LVLIKKRKLAVFQDNNNHTLYLHKPPWPRSSHPLTLPQFGFVRSLRATSNDRDISFPPIVSLVGGGD